MKVLYVAEFDPANVLGGHRAALRAIGVDCRLAVHHIYRTTVPGGKPDWYLSVIGGDLPPAGDPAELEGFAAEADRIVFCPGIGQSWSYASLDVWHGPDAETLPYGQGEKRIEWTRVLEKRARAQRLPIYYVHGSKNVQHNLPAYVEQWRPRCGMFWASTLDYTMALADEPVSYVPPAITPAFYDGAPWPVARLREQGEPLYAVQAPTDPGNCHTKEFVETCHALGVPFQLITGHSQPEAIRLKAQCNFGFDHLRGSFSVNTLENLFLGLVPCFGMRPEIYEAVLRDLWPTFPLGADVPIGGVYGLRDIVQRFRDGWRMTGELQQAARAFAVEHLAPARIAERFLLPALEAV